MRSFQGFVILLVFFSSRFIAAQSGYQLDFKIKSWKDTTVYLGSWIGETHVVRDTTRVKNGAFHFDGKKALPHGVYYLILGKNSLFEFVIGEDQFFSMETHASGYLQLDEYIKNMLVKGDVDNQLFFEDIAFNIEQNKAAMPLIKILKDSTQKEDQKKDARAAFSKINEKVMRHQKEIIEKHPTTMTARRLKADQPIVIPDPPKRPDGTIDSTFQLKYYRQHFFDNFDLADDALLHLPKTLYQEKVKEYLNKLFIPQPDSITKAIKGLVSRAKKNQETYKYLVWYCTYSYQQPEIMGLDEVFVNLYDLYFATGEMDFWVDARLKQNLKEFADKIRSSMIGRPGANLIMQDANLQPQSMYDIKAKYTILFIFKPECSHCRAETPKLVDFYKKNKTKYDLEVFAVATDTSMKLMRDFIKEFKTPWITVDGPRSYVKQHFMTLYHADTTPTIYVLDDKKIIIAKRIPVDRLEDFLSKHEKFLEVKRRGASK
jgi:thiol-disulfide isomerase/thioredoxin